MTQIVKVESVLDIDFEKLREEGIHHIMSDIESTLCPYGEAKVDSAIMDHITAAQLLGHISTFHLITNKTNESFLRSVAASFPDPRQVLYAPGERSDRKPSPILLNQSIALAEAKPEESIMIGDKYTGDMLAAKRAGVAYGFWVCRFGNSDHLGDRLLRRPYERMLRPFVH